MPLAGVTNRNQRKKRRKNILVTMFYYRSKINEIPVCMWKEHIIIQEGTLQSNATTLWLP